MKCTSMCNAIQGRTSILIGKNITEKLIKEITGGISKMTITLEGIAAVLIAAGALIIVIKAKKEDVVKMMEALTKQKLINE